jgi:hypothetical protein
MSMSDPVDSQTSTSYSDPIYDWLEALSQQIRRRIIVYVGVILAIVVAFVIAHQLAQNTPMAGSASTFMRAGHETDAAKRADAYRALVNDTTIEGLFRARAALELVQIALGESKQDEAIKQVAKAAEIAVAVDSLDLTLAVQLSRAAVELQGGDAAKAESTYGAVERSAGAKYPDRRLAAVLGQAMTLEKQGKIADAIAKLEPLIKVEDSAARNFYDLARAQYWRLVRQQADAAAKTVATPAPAAPAAPTPVAAPTTVAPAAAK